ncbi:MAG: hypothetical protein L3J52_07010, partial [Proteobacteria bacterium]|nr:hypothetical protein [Pseudomonadota bacterium]
NQSYQPIRIATGGGKVDYLSMEWSDGVFQTELELEAGRYHLLTETQRQLSSCPVLFANDGTAYKFISDVLGVGGMGFVIGKDKYATPRPWENYLLTEDQLNAEGNFSFYLTEPMEESAYIDSIELEVYDVPDDWFAVLDERMATNDIQATGKIQFFQNTILPIKVTNHLGEDLSDFNQYIDKNPLPITELHPYFLGYAAEEQLYTFELAQHMQGDFILVMNGWVEYGYSQTGFAAWQAGLSLKTPSLELFIDGKWQSWLPNFGYPAGMPRTASVPFSTGNKQFAAFRVRTNQEVYFDQISLIENQQPPEFNKYNLALKKANLKTVGFPERIDLPNRYPVYDFNKKAPFWDTRYMEGAYTKFGDVLPLIKAKDNALAIIAAGEGIYFEFENTLSKKKANTRRYYLLKFHGWAKDMDMMTQYGETLAPIPSTGQISEQAEALNLDYNARFMAGK